MIKTKPQDYKCVFLSVSNEHAESFWDPQKHVLPLVQRSAFVTSKAVKIALKVEYLMFFLSLSFLYSRTSVGGWQSDLKFGHFFIVDF